MKAALITAYGGTSVLQAGEWAQPQPTFEQVLVRVHAAAINPKDTFIRKGRFKLFTGKQFPITTGFDFAGEVVSVGAEVKGYKKGDRVFGMLSDTWEGRTCAEYVCIGREELALMPESLSFEEAAALPLVSLTALQALRDVAGIRPGDSVCINGASGGVGSMAVQLGKALGAKVTAISQAARHTLLTELGATDCIDYRETDIRKSDRTFDVFFDVFGNQRFRDVKPLLSDDGVWVSTVLQPHVFGSALRTWFFARRKARLVIVKANHEDLDRVRQWAEAGSIRPVVHAVFPLDMIAEAHREQESKHAVGKIVVRIA